MPLFPYALVLERYSSQMPATFPKRRRFFSRRTGIWLLLLLLFSALLILHEYQNGCPPWRPAFVPGPPNADGTIAFNPCTMMESMPVWVKISALGWLTAFISFLWNLVLDLARWLRRRKSRTINQAP